jgi:hypothetical protein
VCFPHGLVKPPHASTEGFRGPVTLTENS